MYDTLIFTDTTRPGLPALGAFKCAHVLRKNGYSCLVVNHLSDYTQSELIELIDIAVGKNTFLVGFSNSVLTNFNFKRDPTRDLVFTQGKEFEDQIISYIKNKNNKIKFVVGGTWVWTNFKNRNIDYACIGYSECSIVNLAQHLDKKTPLLKSYKSLLGVTIIDDRTAPEYDFANEDMVWLETDVVNHQCLPIEIGRGCIFKCKFCAFPLNGKKKLDFIKQPNLLQQELQSNFDKYGITTYQIVDDTFNDHELKLEMILESVRKLTFKPKFWAYIRLDLLHLKPHTIDQLYEIGLRAFFFGIETTHPLAGKAIGKGFDFEKLNETIKYIRTTYPDITMQGSFIIGLPHESIEHVVSTFNRLCSQDIPLHNWRFNPLTIKEPGATFDSELSLDHKKYGYKKIDNVSDNHSKVVFINGETTVNWENEHMDWNKAVDLSNSFTSKSFKLEEFKLEGTQVFILASLGLNLDVLASTPKQFIDVDYINKVVRPNFIKNYKSQLIQMITKQNP
jgi:radical SAM superfamily enzyme YgiQ (UPF0313 family)